MIIETHQDILMIIENPPKVFDDKAKHTTNLANHLKYPSTNFDDQRKPTEIF
jgi:hypothetical protein